VSNVLTEEKKNQVIALGRLGWSLRRIERETGVRRETAAGYLEAPGIAVRYPGSWGRQPDSKPANGDPRLGTRRKPGPAGDRTGFTPHLNDCTWHPDLGQRVAVEPFGLQPRQASLRKSTNPMLARE
jgi:hypothetical protein